MKNLYIIFCFLVGISGLYAQDSTKVCYFSNENAIFFLAPKIEGNPYQGCIFLYTSCEPVKQTGIELPIYQFITDYDLSVFHSKDTLTSFYINGKAYTGVAQFSKSADTWTEMYWYQFKEGWLEVADTIKAAIQAPIPAEYKPVLYLYPPEKQDIGIKLNLYNRKMIHPYPAYNEGWEVVAEPDGTLLNKKTGKKHYCLFWETAGSPLMQTIPTGFVVKGEETAAFLEEKLAELGLNEKEANEFIIFWLPQMENNAYNLVHFAQKEYEDVSELDIQPKPETQIRVMMVWQALSQKREIAPQILPTKPIRKGFTAVEWGGTVLNPAD